MKQMKLPVKTGSFLISVAICQKSTIKVEISRNKKSKREKAEKSVDKR